MPGRGGGSRVRALPIFGVGACLAVSALLFAGHAPAQSTAPPQVQMQGDARRGKSISYTCLGCHGIDGYRNAYPNYSVPKLEGQNPQYLEAALHGYRDGDRKCRRFRPGAPCLAYGHSGGEIG